MQTNDTSSTLLFFFSFLFAWFISWIWAQFFFFFLARRLRYTFIIEWVDWYRFLQAQHWYQYMAIIYLFLVLPIWNTLLLVINPKLVSLSLSQLRIVYQNLNTNWTWVHCQCHRTGYESSMMNEIVSEFQLKVNYFRWQRSQNDSVWSVCVCACACVIVFFYFIATQKNISVKSLIFIFLLILTSFYPLLSIYKVTHTHIHHDK